MDVSEWRRLSRELQKVVGSWKNARDPLWKLTADAGNSEGYSYEHAVAMNDLGTVGLVALMTTT